jgi:hypothetical protein
MMKRAVAIVVAVVLVAGFTAQALAWEFEMKGEYEHRYRYFGRTGGTDLFGNVALQENTGIFVGFAGPNIYGTGNIAAIAADSASSLSPGLSFNLPSSLFGLPIGVPWGGGSAMRITRGGFSRWGSDASYNDARLTFRPTIRLNPAVRVSAVYTIGGMRNKYKRNDVVENKIPWLPIGWGMSGSFGLGAAPLERYYMAGSSVNAYDGTPGTWEQFRLTAHFPWGLWSLGLKDFPFGTGATLGENTRAEHFLWVAPYGPFRFLWAVWLSNGRFAQSWASVPDNDTKPSLYQGYAATYDAGSLSLGWATILRMFHQKRGALPVMAQINPILLNTPSIILGANSLGLEYFNLPPGSGDPYTDQLALDETTLVNVAFFKYNNGRFFANAEYSWVNVDTTFLPNRGVIPFDDNGVILFSPGPKYLEANHFFAEAGIMAGPSKLSLMYARASGNVLDRLLTQPNGLPRSNPTKVYAAYPINYQVMEPYEFLMFNTFAGGNNGGWNATDVTFVSEDHGMMSDGYCLAGRLDYAVAANLNVYGSYIWAHRLERAGFLNGGVIDTGNGSRSANWGLSPNPLAGRFVPPRWLPGQLLSRYGGTTPYVPDGFIGWEANLGVDWKLLENLTFKVRYSYWKPGQWFDYAYQAWGTFQGVVDDGTVVKDRSPIMALQATVLAEF